MPYRTTSRVPQGHFSLWRLIRANAYDFATLLRESWLVLVGFALIAVSGSIYLRFFYPPTPSSPRPDNILEAFYQTFQLLTFQSSLAFPDSDPLGEVMFFLFPFLGLALIFQSVLNFARLLLDKSSRREAWQVSLASTYQQHVIVCGLGRVGLRAINQLLEAGYEPVVIQLNWDSEFVPQLIQRSIPVVLGDARNPEVLRQAGLLRARALICAISDDLANIEIALIARNLRPDGMRCVLRIFNEDLDRSLERSFGQHSAFSASALAAPTYAAAAVSRDIETALPVFGQVIATTQIVAAGVARLTPAALERAYDVRLLNLSPPVGLGNGTIANRSRITAIGTLDALERLRLANAPDERQQRPDERRPLVIICGLGKVGYRVVRQLARISPRPEIVVVRRDGDTADFASRIDQIDGLTTILGDAADIDVLRQAGIDRAYAVAALTSNDLLNLQIGLAARRHREDIRVVLRVFSDALSERLADLVGIHTAYSTSGLAAPTLVAAAVHSGIRHAFVSGGRLFVTQRQTIAPDHPLLGQTVEAVRDRGAGLILGMRRGQHTSLLPPPETALALDDLILLLLPR